MMFRFPANQNIGNLPGKVMLKLRERLDQAPQTQNWRAFVALLESPFIFRQSEIEKFSLQIYQNGGSPSGQLLLALAARGMCVRHLVKYLDLLKLEVVLMDFKNYEAITITAQPESHLKLYEGEPMVLSVEATGFPYPRYQWFRGNDEVVKGATEHILKIDHVRPEHGGKYCCRLHNSADVNQVKLTDDCIVKVYARKMSGRDPTEGTDLSDNENVECEKKHNLPVIVFHPRDSFVVAGSTVYLKCEVKGRQPLHYVWFKDKQFYKATPTSDLQLDNVSMNESGRYHCHVNNDYGEAVSIPAIVQVDYTPVFHRPHIIIQPAGCQAAYGGMADFMCRAAGPDFLEYQWFQDDIPIPGAMSPNLRLCDVKGNALIHCKVTSRRNMADGGHVEDSRNCVFSNKVPLSIRHWPEPNPMVEQYTATDKVALLIGNYNYRCEHSLKAPKRDTQILSDIFRSLGFKVVALLNLTLNEMKAAVAEFCKLLGDGVYAVFYFVGHGFEEKGCCYFVPEDALTDFSEKDCLCANAVLAAMQQKKPKICAMILDICRKRNKNGQSDSSQESPVVFPNSPAGNSVICYATCTDLAAYEIGETGILVKHLQKHLRQPIEIEKVFQHMRKDIGRENLVQGKQIPEVRTDLQEPFRSFCDRIQYHNGWTEEFNMRCLMWQNAHVIPDSMEVVASKDLGIVLQLDFQTSFSNVLQVFVTVKEIGKTEECIAWISRLPNTVSVDELPNKVSEGKTKNSIQDIQKLKNDLEINISVRFRRLGSIKEEVLSVEKVNLGLPLVAKLKLWQPQPSREPTEQTEDLETFIYSREK